MLIGGAKTWSQISLGGNPSVGAPQALALDTDGALYTWGWNTVGQLGSNDDPSVIRSSPVQVGTSSWTGVSAGGNSSFGLLV